MRLLSLLLVLNFVTCAGPNCPTGTAMAAKARLGERPKNIILVIGDGMATPQISASVYWRGAKKTVFKRFPILGFHKSHSCDDLTTDSAAGATAFSCGEKTNNGAIGVLCPNDQPCTTILESLDRQGYATGMVVTCSAPHATPASFIAHREMRAFTEEIALDYLKTPIDCFIGGGEYFFKDRPDGIQLDDSLRQRGYVIRRGQTFSKLPLDGSAPFMLFTAYREPESAKAGRAYLPKAARVACDFLKLRSDKGFFLMVEGSQIDWAGHANNAEWLKSEMEDFEKTLEGILAFAQKDGQTLVIVTGDHECGGFALPNGANRKSFKPTFGTKLHTPALTPVFAYGPGAENFSGIYENTAIYRKMRACLGVN